MNPDLFADPLWRLANLYHIKRADDGRVIPFEPRPEQQQVYDLILRQGCKRLIILKARRLGMSTAIDVLLADQVLFNAGVQASLVDCTMADAERKLSTIVRTAFDSLPPMLRDRYQLLRDSGSTLELSMGEDSPSSFFAGLRARGGTNNWLHLSEWGVIQADDPKRSEEILTGAIPSAEHGVIIVETTWKGGRGGHLWELVKTALETPDSAKTAKDWRVLFFPWWRDPTYTLDGDPDTVRKDTAQYLDTLEKEIGQQLTAGQRVWYDRQERNLGMFVFREFPSTIDECFKSPVEGAIYADQLDKLRAAGAIGPRLFDDSALVHTSWDLGSPENTVTWYWQSVGTEIRVIDVDMDLDMTPVQRVSSMLAKGYNYGTHFLPHDAASTNSSGRTFQGELQSAGLKNCRCVPRTADVWVGINRLRQLMPRMTFRLPACDAGLTALANYHYRRFTSTGLAQNEPVHDWSSHAADALRILAEAEMAGMIQGMANPRVTPVVRTGFRNLQTTRRAVVLR